MSTPEAGPEAFVPAETLEIRNLETLKVMANSARMQIVDLLRRDAATVKEMAAALRVPPKSLYYHINLLQQHGLIRVVETRLVSGILEKRYRATAYLFNFAEMTGAPGVPLSRSRFEGVTSLLAITQDEIGIALDSGTIDPADAAPCADRLNVDWQLLSLPPTAIEQLVKRIEGLIEEARSQATDVPETQTYRLLLALFPTYRRGERPDVASVDVSSSDEP